MCTLWYMFRKHAILLLTVEVKNKLACFVQTIDSLHLLHYVRLLLNNSANIVMQNNQRLNSKPTAKSHRNQHNYFCITNI